MKYDPEIIERYAEAMYSEAERIAISTAVVWGLGGALLGAAFGQTLLNNLVLMALLGAGLAGFIGYKRGEGKAFALKLEAQTALCQVQIERNTKTG